MKKICIVIGWLLAYCGVAWAESGDWTSDRWLTVTGVSFEPYGYGQLLDARLGTDHGHWDLPPGGLPSCFSSEDESGRKYMILDTPTNNVTFISDRLGRKGGGNVLLFSVQTMSRSGSLPELQPGSKGGFAIAPGDDGTPVFIGKCDGGWCELKDWSGAVSPSREKTWYDGAMRFRLDGENEVQVQYLVKALDGTYVVLGPSAGDDGWLKTGVKGDASVGAVDFYGVGGLERLSSREKNGFSVRLR